MNHKFISLNYIKKFVPNFNIQENDIIVLDTKIGVENFYILNLIYNENSGKLTNTIICRYFHNKSTRGRRNCIGPCDLGELNDIGILLGILNFKENNAIIRLKNRQIICNLIKYYKTENNLIITIRKLPNELFDKIFEHI